MPRVDYQTHRISFNLTLAIESDNISNPMARLCTVGSPARGSPYTHSLDNHAGPTLSYPDAELYSALF